MLSLFLILEVLIFSSLMYAIENADNDGIYSVPSAMWLVFITMCTVGYGDVFPVTDLGRVCGVVLVFTGFVVMSIVIVIIGGNFDKHYKIFQKKRLRFKKLMLIMQYKEQGVDVKALLRPSVGLVQLQHEVDALNTLRSRNDANSSKENKPRPEVLPAETTSASG